MNEIAMIDKNMSMDRTPQLIAVEINSIKEQTRKLVLFNSIEIGRRLTEAKLMIEHGEWSEWLEKYVDYSQRTASNLMRIFTDYGSSQITLFCDNAKSQALANLSYTQAVALLGIPTEEREEFIQEHDVDGMSTRELQQAIKDKQELEAKLKEVEAGWKNAKKETEAADRSLNDLTDSYTELQEALLKSNKEAEIERKRYETLTETYDQLVIRNREQIETAISLRKELEGAKVSGNTDEIERLSESLVKTDDELAASLSKIEELERQLKETPIEVTAAPVIEKVPEEIERELNELREKNKELEAKGAQPINTATIRFKLHFDTLVKGFGDLLSVLTEIDPEAQGKYKNAVSGLIGKMSERL